MTRRVAVTGVGVVAPGGDGAPAFWDLLSNGRTATRGITLFDPAGFRSRIAAECDFDPAAHGFDSEEVERSDRYVQFAMAAAAEAVRDAGLDLEKEDPWRIGVSLGTAVGGTTRLEQDYVAVSGTGARWDVDHRPAGSSSAAGLLAQLPRVLGGRTGRRPRPGADGLDGLHLRPRRDRLRLPLRRGRPRRRVCGRCLGLTDLPHHRGVLRRDQGDLAEQRRPASTPPGRSTPSATASSWAREGRSLVLEELEHARARGATVYCEISGYATFGNAYHMTGLTTEGLEMAEAITTALDHARLDSSRIDYVNAHGSGTKQNDRHETAAVKRSLGAHAYEVPMSSIKSMVGHSLGAIGAIEIVACVLAMAHQVVPPTANYSTPDPECDLDYVPRTARQ